MNQEDLAAQEFTEQIVTKRAIDEDVYSKAKEVFGYQGLVEMLMLIGCSQNICGFLNAFSIPAPTSSAKEIPDQKEVR